MIHHDEETLRVLEAAERHVAGSCDCPGAHHEHTPECERAVLLACAIAEDVLSAFARAILDLEETIARRKLEMRIERLERALAAAGGADVRYEPNP